MSKRDKKDVKGKVKARKKRAKKTNDKDFLDDVLDGIVPALSEDVVQQLDGVGDGRVESKKINRALSKAVSEKKTTTGRKGPNEQIIAWSQEPEEVWYPEALRMLEDYRLRVNKNYATEFKNKPSQAATMDTKRDSSHGTYMMILRRAKNYPLLTNKEEVYFIRLYQEKGNMEAYDFLVNANTLFVISVVNDRKFYATALDRNDMIIDGLVGVQTVLDKYDPSKGYQLVTLMASYIHQSIIDSINKNGRTIRLPASVYAHMSRISKATEYLNKTVGFGVWDDTDLLEEANRNYLDKPNQIIKPHHLELIRTNTEEALSLERMYDSSSKDDQDTSLEDYITYDEEDTPADLARGEELSELIRRIVKETLEEDEIKFLDESLGLYSEKKTQKQIIEERGIDRKTFQQKQRQIYAKLMPKIREAGGEVFLPEN